MSERPDSELVCAALAGQKEAFGVLYDRYAALVRAICFDFTGEHHQASDLAQEVFVRAYGRLGSLKSPERFAGWLKGITRLVCLEWCRAATRSKTSPLISDPPADDSPEDGDVADLLEKAMAAVLSDRERLAVHAYHLMGDSVERSRQVTGLSRSGLFKVLRRAREKLRNHLERISGTSDER